MRKCTVLILLLSALIAGQLSIAQNAPDSNADSGSSTNSNPSGEQDHPGNGDSAQWLYPVTKLNHALPDWFRIGGQYRGRVEGPTGIGFASTNDSYYLERIRLHMGIQPKDWLLFYGEAQD